MKKRPKDASVEQGEKTPRLELNRRQRAIVESGILVALRPSALVVLHYAIAHANFATCLVYLGARTVAGVAFNGSKNRTNARRGIAELIDVGILVPVEERTYRKATVYRIEVPANRAQGCALTGRRAVPSGGTGLSPDRTQGCAPNPISHASLRRSMGGNRPSTAAEGDAQARQAARLRSLHGAVKSKQGAKA